jgi:hypothetical protein
LAFYNTFRKINAHFKKCGTVVTYILTLMAYLTSFCSGTPQTDLTGDLAVSMADLFHGPQVI